MDSRAYIPRIWRVPKDSGPACYLANLICKKLRKHAWPAQHLIIGDGPVWQLNRIRFGYVLRDDEVDYSTFRGDFHEAITFAAYIVASQYRVQIDMPEYGLVEIQKLYRITDGGFFKEVPHDYYQKTAFAAE